MFENWNCLVCGKTVEPGAWFIIAQDELRDRPVHLECAFNSGRIPPSRRSATPRERCPVCAERMNPNEALVLLNPEEMVHFRCDANSIRDYLEYLHVSPVIQKLEKIILGMNEARRRYERLREEGQTVVSWICLNCNKPLQDNREFGCGVHASCPRIT
ncbi:MAG: hypothetical protein ACETWM_21655 [Candidatus Lokiarchaeia archaeon]